MTDSDDDVQLSEYAQAALMEFLNEQKAAQERESAAQADAKTLAKESLQEDWQLSQFWYDEKTCVSLEKMVKGALGKNCLGGQVCCISSPTLMKHLVAQGDFSEENLTLLEFDRRFEAFQNFHFWDFNEPLKIDEKLKNKFDVIIADPPFLNEDCFVKTCLAINYLAKPDCHVMFCTGAVQEEVARRVRPDLNRQKFEPRHKNNLSNDFALFANFDADQFVTQ